MLLAMIEDPGTAARGDRPNSYLLCPAETCAARADAISPTFDRPLEEVERAWLRLMDRQPRVDLLDRDPVRHLYLFRQRSAVFGFPDLITVRFLDVTGGATLIVHSRSVYGYWDLGVNRRRVEDWISRLRVALTAS
jgi:uncharacterized protein (DUF1499 family)